MLEKEFYINGQRVFEMNGDILTYFYKNGVKKAEGLFINDKMEGDWKFYRESGQLWQTGQFKNNNKNGAFTRFGRNGQIEYQENFLNGKLSKAKNNECS